VRIDWIVFFHFTIQLRNHLEKSCKIYKISHLPQEKKKARQEIPTGLLIDVDLFQFLSDSIDDSHDSRKRPVTLDALDHSLAHSDTFAEFSLRHVAGGPVSSHPLSEFGRF